MNSEAHTLCVYSHVQSNLIIEQRQHVDRQDSHMEGTPGSPLDPPVEWPASKAAGK